MIYSTSILNGGRASDLKLQMWEYTNVSIQTDSKSIKHFLLTAQASMTQKVSATVFGINPTEFKLSVKYKPVNGVLHNADVKADIKLLINYTDGTHDLIMLPISFNNMFSLLKGQDGYALMETVIDIVEDHNIFDVQVTAQTYDLTDGLQIAYIDLKYAKETDVPENIDGFRNEAIIYGLDSEKPELR
jgi:hypothetical protein